MKDYSKITPLVGNSTLSEEERIIIKEALKNDDLNLVRVIVEGSLYDIKVEFEHALLFKDNYEDIIEDYKTLLELDHKVTELYEGI